VPGSFGPGEPTETVVQSLELLEDDPPDDELVDEAAGSFLEDSFEPLDSDEELSPLEAADDPSPELDELELEPEAPEPDEDRLSVL